MRLACLLALVAAPVLAETPADLEKLLATAAEPGIVMFEIARQYAIAGDRKQALAWMEKAAALNPEYDPEFYLSSVNKRKVVEVAPDGTFRDFVSEGREGLGYFFGMKVDPRTNTLWANSLSNREGSGVFHFDLATGRPIKKSGICTFYLCFLRSRRFGT